MQRSKYTYFFETEDEYVGYSWLADDYFSFPLRIKEKVEFILENPDLIISNLDVRIYYKLLSKKAVIPDDFDEYKYLLALREKAINRNGILSLTVLPTTNCNCRCPYCYEYHDNDKMDQETIDNLKSFINSKKDQLQHLNLVWFGGEPLLYPHIVEEIGVYCRELTGTRIKFTSSMTTNAVLLNEQNCKILNKAGVKTVQVTFDAGKETHDQIRRTVNKNPTFETIIKNIRLFLDFNKENTVNIRIHIHSTEKKEIEGILKILDYFKDYSEKISVYFRTLFGSNLKLNIELISGLYKRTQNLGFSIPPGISEKQYVYCVAEKNYAWVVRPDGYIGKCTVSLEKEGAIGKLNKDGIKIYWNRYSTWKDKFKGDKLLECDDCKVFPFCWGLCLLNRYKVKLSGQDDYSEACKNMRSSNMIKEKLLFLKLKYQNMKLN